MDARAHESTAASAGIVTASAMLATSALALALFAHFDTTSYLRELPILLDQIIGAR